MTLLQRTQAISQKSQDAELDVLSNRVAAALESDRGLAREIIANLPLELANAATKGNILNVMQLDEDLHIKSSYMVETKIARLAELHGVLSVLMGAGLTVAKFLIDEGFTVTIDVVSHDDPGQGRAWSTIQLFASW